MDTHTTSYVQLIRLPNVLPLLAAICLSRFADRMFAVAIVFHAIAAFGSPALAGFLSFAATAPGLLVSPLAGAFLDRAGATRGVIVDLACSTALVLVLTIAIASHQAGPPVLLMLATAYALTSPLSASGVRVLLPRLVPASSLDRANALDTTIFAIVDVVAPSLAGAMIGLAGPIPTFTVIAAAYIAATLCVGLVRGAARPPPSGQPFFREARDGLGYVLRRPLLRGLAISYGLNNFVWGVMVVAVPVFVAKRFDPGVWESISGLLWAGLGAASGIGAMMAGRARIVGREVRVMGLCMIATALALWPVAAMFGLAGLAIGLALYGLLAGPIDVSLLTLRQRRTEPGRLGRVLAVSMALNTTGFPIGTALGGMLVAWSLQSAFVVAALASLLGALAAFRLIPAEDQDP
jgi:MFS family permease